MKGLKNIWLICMLPIVVTQTAIAQTNNVNKAIELYSAKKLDSAKTVINEAVQNPESAKDYNAWMMRGVIYKDLYKTNEMSNVTSPYRDSATVSFIQSLQLDAENKNPQKELVLKSLNYLASLYHNDINKTLDTVNYQQSLINSDKHKAIKKVIDPTFNEQKYNYEVYSTVGSMFEKGFEKSMSKNLLDLAKTYLMKAYEINSNTDFINKNIGVLYYNQAVDIIKKMDYDVPLDQLPVYQDQSVKMGQQALPYLIKANQINPSDKSVVEGLAGIYYLLNDSEKYNEYKKKFEEMNKQ
jgi:tetratricopeptide (TPR) repeat protein